MVRFIESCFIKNQYLFSIDMKATIILTIVMLMTLQINAQSGYRFKYQAQPEVKISGTFKYNPNAGSTGTGVRPSGKFKYNPNAGSTGTGVKPSGKFKYNPNASSNIVLRSGGLVPSSTGNRNNGSVTTKMKNEKREYVDKIIYAPNYTGEDNREWCAQCQSYSSKHSHVKQRVW